MLHLLFHLRLLTRCQSVLSRCSRAGTGQCFDIHFKTLSCGCYVGLDLMCYLVFCIFECPLVYNLECLWCLVSVVLVLVVVTSNLFFVKIQHQTRLIQLRV